VLQCKETQENQRGKLGDIQLICAMNSELQLTHVSVQQEFTACDKHRMKFAA
jgi:hypothetical protein